MLADDCKALCQDPSPKEPVCGRTPSGVYKVFPSSCAACQQGAAIEDHEDCPDMKSAEPWDMGRPSHAAADNRPVVTMTHDCAPGVKEVKCDVSICSSVKCSEGLECYLDPCGACKTGTASHMRFLFPCISSCPLEFEYVKHMVGA